MFIPFEKAYANDEDPTPFTPQTIFLEEISSYQQNLLKQIIKEELKK